MGGKRKKEEEEEGGCCEGRRVGGIGWREGTGREKGGGIGREG